MSTLVLELVLVAAGSGAQGHVAYATGKRAYVDRGSAAGVHAGLVLRVRRADGVKVESCVVEEVSESSAACVGAGLRPGDVVVLPDEGARVATPPVGDLAPLASGGELAEAHAALAASPYPKVDAGIRRTRVGRRLGAATASLGHASYVSASGGSYQRERVRMSVRGAEVGVAGLRAAAELEARYWAQGREPTSELLVWDAELSSRERGEPFAVALGRIWPYFVPGVSVFDGAQLGLRNEPGTLEGGLFGGLVPDPRELRPRASRWIAGAYVAHLHDGEDGALVQTSRIEARLSTRNDADGAVGAEAEGVAAARLGDFTELAAGARLDSRAELTGAQLSARIRPSEALTMSASGRFVGERTFEDELGSGSSPAQRLLTGDADVSWSVGLGLLVSLTGGVTRSSAGAQTRGYIGPEVSVPSAFGELGGFGVGYREELGWLPGRSAYVQATLSPADAWQLLARLSYFEDRPPGGGAWREAGLYGAAQLRLRDWLRARASLLGRGDLTISEDEELRLGAVGSLEVEASF